MVRDRIVPVDGDAVERWGGIGYSVAAAAATLPATWTVRAVVRAGADLADEIERTLSAIPRTSARISVVPEPNNRVELVYHDRERRTEHLTGGVSGWSAEALSDALGGCEAVLVNFISGHELDLRGLQAFRRSNSARLYADLHSLFLGTEADGTRTPRLLTEWRAWLGCLDAVQMNEDEFDQLRASPDGPETIVDVVEAGPGVVSVTRGSAGATVGFRAGGRSLVRDVTVTRPRTGDPTGCGDIWGAVMFGRLLAGETEARAAEIANRVAAASLDHHGVEGLAERLADVSLDDGAGAFLDSATEDQH